MKYPTHVDRFQLIELVELLIDGLLVDGGHHKQWYLERALETLGMDLKEIADELAEEDYDWEMGIAP